MPPKILVANRGEISVRIIQECKKMKIKTVSICSDIERDSLWMRLADEGYCIGSSSAKDSYMNIDAIINIADVSKSALIHPGYGFLSEKFEFAQRCEHKGFSFIGSPHHVLMQVSDKITLKWIADSQQIPVLKGYLVNEISNAILYANKLGYPVMIKISNSGGGVGVRSAFCNDELVKALKILRAINNGKVFIEKYIEKARHIEIQIMADYYGNILILGNRECSIQLNNKKVLEECPAQNISMELLKQLYSHSLRLIKTVGYVGIGTLEFLVDENENYYFMEMNARIQVEHGITEMITGINLVQWQIKIALGERIPFIQTDINFYGHAIECRINAQSYGKINTWYLTNCEARFDHSLINNMSVTPHYDPLLGKLISHGQTKDIAIYKMYKYLNDLKINGIETNIEMHKKIINSNYFKKNLFYKFKKVDNYE